MKLLIWLGDSLDDLKKFPAEARREAGYQLDRIQHGLLPSDFKPMPTIGAGVHEVRIHIEGEHRIFYVAKFSDAIYVLHAFTKKSQRTLKRDINLAAFRLRSIVHGGGK